MNTSVGTFRSILVPTDFSPAADAALDQAVALARSGDAEVTVAHVVKDIYTAMQLMAYGPVWSPMSEHLGEEQQSRRTRAQEQLRGVIAPYEAAGARIRQQVLVGTPFVAIIQAVQLGGYDLVVTGMRGQSAMKRALVGSTATRLARKCPCPVWIARPRESNILRSVLVPLDFSDMGRRTLDLAASLALPARATLHLLHVYDAADMYGVPVLPEDSKAEFARYRRQVRRAALDQLKQMSDSLSSQPESTTLSVTPGITWQVIRSTARRVDADVIVMGSVGRGGIPGLLIGNTAEKVMHAADVSVLIVKPDDFVSPVPLPDGVSRQPERLRGEPVAI